MPTSQAKISLAVAIVPPRMIVSNAMRASPVRPILASFIETGAIQPTLRRPVLGGALAGRSEEHTSALQTRSGILCRPLLGKKNTWLAVQNSTRLDSRH